MEYTGWYLTADGERLHTHSFPYTNYGIGDPQTQTSKELHHQAKQLDKAITHLQRIQKYYKYQMKKKGSK